MGNKNGYDLVCKHCGKVIKLKKKLLNKMDLKLWLFGNQIILTIKQK